MKIFFKALESLIQYILDAFHHLRGWLLNWIVYLSFRTYGLEVSRSHIKEESYGTYQYQHICLDKVHPDGFLEVSKAIYDQAKSRIDEVAEKCQTLLRVASFVLAAFGLLLPKYLAFDDVFSRVVFLLSALLLLNSILLLLAFYQVRAATILDYGQNEAELGEADLKKSLINDYRRLAVDVENRNDYLVDIYKVARFFFLSSFTVFVCLFSWTFLSNKSKTDSSIPMETLTSHISLVKGAPGAKGEQGERGPSGEKGERGEKGDKGDTPQINEELIIRRLLSDQRFREAVTKAVEDAQKHSMPQNGGK